MPLSDLMFADVLFFEDVREERDNRMSLMGVYQNDIVVPDIPHVLPELRMLITLGFEEAAHIQGLRIRVEAPGMANEYRMAEELVREAMGGIDAKPNEGETPSHLPFRFSCVVGVRNIRIDHEGEIAVDVLTDTHATRAGRIRVVRTGP